MRRKSSMGGLIAFAFLFAFLSAFSPSCLFGQDGENSSMSRFDLLKKQNALVRKYIDSSKNIPQQLNPASDLNKPLGNIPTTQVLSLPALGVESITESSSKNTLGAKAPFPFKFIWKGPLNSVEIIKRLPQALTVQGP